MEDKKAVFVLSLVSSALSPASFALSSAWLASGGAPRPGVGFPSGWSVGAGPSAAGAVSFWVPAFWPGGGRWFSALPLAGSPAVSSAPALGARCVVVVAGAPWVLVGGAAGSWVALRPASLACCCAASPAFARFCGRRGGSAAEAAAFLSVAVSS